MPDDKTGRDRPERDRLHRDRPERDLPQRELPAAVVQQPDPALDEQQPGPYRIALTLIGAAAVVVLVLYGLSRPEQRPQMANAPQAASQPSTSGQGQPAAGQNQAQNGAQGQTQNQQKETEPGRGKAPRADSATTGRASAPSDQPATGGAQQSR